MINRSSNQAYWRQFSLQLDLYNAFYSDQTNTINFNIDLDINKFHLHIIMLQIAIIYLVWRGQKYATIQTVCLLTSLIV